MPVLAALDANPPANAAAPFALLPNANAPNNERPMLLTPTSIPNNSSIKAGPSIVKIPAANNATIFTAPSKLDCPTKSVKIIKHSRIKHIANITMNVFLIFSMIRLLRWPDSKSVKAVPIEKILRIPNSIII